MSIGDTTARCLDDIGINDLFADESHWLEGQASIAGMRGGKLEGMSSEHLAKTWRIDVETARHTVNANVQVKQHNADGKFA